MGCTNSKSNTTTPSISSSTTNSPSNSFKKNNKKNVINYEDNQPTLTTSNLSLHNITVDLNINDDDLITDEEEKSIERCDTEIDLVEFLEREKPLLHRIAIAYFSKTLSCEELMKTWSLIPHPQSPSLLHHILKEAETKEGFLNYVIKRNEYISQLQRNLINENNGKWMFIHDLGAFSPTEKKVFNLYISTLLSVLTTKLNSENTRERVNSVTTSSASNLPPLPPASRIKFTSPVKSFSHQHNSQNFSYNSSLELNYNPNFKSIQFVSLAKPEFYTVKESNYQEYELPPGLITLIDVKNIIELYRKGGRLITRSLLKILTLTYHKLVKEPNISKVTIKNNSKLTVVGDLHGQLNDLLHILDTSGLPTNGHKYVFNGDFVDRGKYSVEVCAIIFSLYLACPGSVFLNRGNHEDYMICSIYGFKSEVEEKYDGLVFSLFTEVFKKLPLFTIVNSSVFIVHGGLFHNDGITLKDLENIDREKFQLEDSGLDNGPIMKEEDQDNFYRQLARDALWSDPVNQEGRTKSIRGAGIAFGYDIAQQFLDLNDLKFIVRSHECVRSGYEEPYTHVDENGNVVESNLCTIFSASNYGEMGNHASYLEFFVSTRPNSNLELNSTNILYNSTPRVSSSHSLSSHDSVGNFEKIHQTKRIKDTDLCYNVHTFFAQELQEPVWDDDKQNYCNSSNQSSLSISPYSSPDLTPNDFRSNLGLKINIPSSFSNRHCLDSVRNNKKHLIAGASLSLEELIWSRKSLLMEAFSKVDQAKKLRNFERSRSRSQSQANKGVDRSRSLSNCSINSTFNLHGSLYEPVHSFNEDDVDDGIIFCDIDDLFDDHDNVVLLGDWIEIMNEVLDVSLLWNKLFSYIINPNYILHAPYFSSQPLIRYKLFLNDFQSELVRVLETQKKESKKMDVSGFRSLFTKNDDELKDTSKELKSHSDPDANYFGYKISPNIIKSFYNQTELIEKLFILLDEDKDGFFDIEDVKRVCHSFNIEICTGQGPETLVSHSHQLSTFFTSSTPFTTRKKFLFDDQYFINILDFTGNGLVDLNSLFEVNRLCFNDTHEEELQSFKSGYVSSQNLSKDVLSELKVPLSHSFSPRLSVSVFNSLPHTPTATSNCVELKTGVEISVDNVTKPFEKDPQILIPSTPISGSNQLISNSPPDNAFVHEHEQEYGGITIDA